MSGCSGGDVEGRLLDVWDKGFGVKFTGESHTLNSPEKGK